MLDYTKMDGIGLIYVNKDGEVLGAKYTNKDKAHIFQMKAMIKDMLAAGFELEEYKERPEEKIYE